MPEETQQHQAVEARSATSQSEAQAAETKQPPWGHRENFDPDKAWDLIQNLRKERGSGSAELQQQLADMQKAQDDQRRALAAALGFAPEDAPDATEALTSQVQQLQEQFTTAQRKATLLELAAEHKIPTDYQHLLTATEPDALAAQAKSVGELVAARQAAQSIPGFAESAGQGQGSGQSAPLTAQIAAAETELRDATVGSPEHQAARRKVANLKSQQLIEASKSTR